MLPTRRHGPKSWWSIGSAGATAPAPLPTTWRKNSWHRYDMKKLRHCRPMFWAESSYFDSSHYYYHNHHHSMQHSFVIFFPKLLSFACCRTFNNFYEGIFILYRHDTLPFEVRFHYLLDERSCFHSCFPLSVSQQA